MSPIIATHKQRALVLLVFFHVLIIASSNFLVQFPLTIMGFHSTWGALSYPFIFLATDLTVRIFGAKPARTIIFWAMLPALAISYFISVLFHEGEWLGINTLLTFNLFVARIAIASFSAYIVGQMMDIYVFNYLRENKAWWVAPSASAIIGNALDTVVFFAIAFYKTSDPYLANNLVEIAFVDYLFKIMVCIIFFLPLYGILLKKIMARIAQLPHTC